MEDEEVAATVQGRKFFSIENLDSVETRSILQKTS